MVNFTGVLLITEIFRYICVSFLAANACDLYLKTRHSFCSPRQRAPIVFNSDVNVSKSSSQSHEYSSPKYYERYEHDEVPVRESDLSATTDKDVILTNSELDKIEKRVYETVSQELQTDESSSISLDSNIKFFKTTVEKLFENFYTSMRDFDLYKQRFNEILAKNKEESLVDMEDFINDMFQNMMSSVDIKVTGSTTTAKRSGNCDASTPTNSQGSEGYVTFYNGNLNTDSSFNEQSSATRSSGDGGETFNLYLVGGTSCVQINVVERSRLSEINIRNLDYESVRNKFASAENLKKLGDEFDEDSWAAERRDRVPSDLDIRVKKCSAKKNIYSNEDFTVNEGGDAKSLLTKICSYICKKFRK